MRKQNKLISMSSFIALIFLIFITSCQQTKKVKSSDKITVAAYYFPNYHTDDPRNIINKGPGWSEWELVKAARPRFPGHHQPNVPAWGYTDEKDPEVMAKKSMRLQIMESTALFSTGTCMKMALS